jgi:hypothetical protein
MASSGAPDYCLLALLPLLDSRRSWIYLCALSLSLLQPVPAIDSLPHVPVQQGMGHLQGRGESERFQELAVTAYTKPCIAADPALQQAVVLLTLPPCYTTADPGPCHCS